jgi:hypothetical protein
METIHLIGAESVSSAGYNMKQAAEQMGNVSSNIQLVFEAHQRFLDDWLRRFEEALEKVEKS